MSTYEANYLLDFRPMMLGDEKIQCQREKRQRQREKRQREREDVVLFWRSFWLFGAMVLSLGFMPALIEFITL